LRELAKNSLHQLIIYTQMPHGYLSFDFPFIGIKQCKTIISEIGELFKVLFEAL
jgi:hypothetical protein